MLTMVLKSRQAESGSSGGNFKLVVPVEENEDTENYTVVVEGQTLRTTRDVHLRHGLQGRHADWSASCQQR